jgi:riboflavin biosynthesis pyrimidine reductase
MKTLLDHDASCAGAPLPEELRDLYGGELQFPTDATRRPYVIGNFVSTLDGVVSYKIAGQADGSAISGFDFGDRFIMGLLRASADAVLVGAGTIRDAGIATVWTPADIYPKAANLYANYRNMLRKPLNPLAVVVSGSGNLDLKRAAFQNPEISVLIVTTTAGEKALVEAGAAELRSVDVRALADESRDIDPGAILELLQSQFAVERVLHEGGPTLFGEFLAAGAVDELFLTMSPRIAGRAPEAPRPGAIEGTEFSPNTAPRFRLISVKQNAEYLYLRYRRS